MNAVDSGRVGRTYTWRRAQGLMDHFALHVDGEVLALLSVGGPGRALAELRSGEWRFLIVADRLRHRGIHVLLVTGPDTTSQIVAYEPNLRGTGGHIRLAGGGWLRWLQPGWSWRWSQWLTLLPRSQWVAWPRPHGVGNWLPGARRRWDGFWRPDYIIVDRNGDTLLRFGTDGTVVSGRWEFSTSTTSPEFLGVLALGWLLIMLAADQGMSF